MKTEDWIWLAQADRRNGKTTTMAAAAKLLKATLVCMSIPEANRVGREHDCPTIAVSEPMERLRGRPLGPFLFDPSAVMQICIEARMEIAAAEARAKHLEVERDAARAERETAEGRVKELARKLAEADKELKRQASELDEERYAREEAEEHANDLEEDADAAAEDEAARVEALARLVANPTDADAIRAAKDLLPAEKGGYL